MLLKSLEVASINVISNVPIKLMIHFHRIYNIISEVSSYIFKLLNHSWAITGLMNKFFTSLFLHNYFFLEENEIVTQRTSPPVVISGMSFYLSRYIKR